MNKTTFLTALVLLLIGVNGVTLYLLFKKNRGRERRPNPAMFYKKLGLDEQQEQQFEVLRKVHFQTRDSLKYEELRLHKVMSDMIMTGVKDSSAIDSITTLLSANRKQFETGFYYHFQKMHSLLKPDQQQKLGEVLDWIIKRQGPPDKK